MIWSQLLEFFKIVFYLLVVLCFVSKGFEVAINIHLILKIQWGILGENRNRKDKTKLRVCLEYNAETQYALLIANEQATWKIMELLVMAGRSTPVW